MQVLNKAFVVECCRILGVHVTASTKELKQARDRLAKIYHPDKNVNLSSEALKINSDRFKKIQNAYEYLTSHYQVIQDTFNHLTTYSLTARGPRTNLSHWVYSTIQSIKSEDD